MKNFAKLPYFKQILFAVILFITCISTFHGFLLLMPSCSTYFTRELEILPSLITVVGGPLFTLIMYWIYINAKNQSLKWKTLFVYGIVIAIASVLCLVLHIVFMITKYGFDLYGNVSWLFPYDIIALQLIFIALGILSIIRSIKTKEYKNIPSTVQEVITKGKIAKFSVAICFATWFAGASLAFPYVLIDGYMDPNWWMMIPVFLLFYVPLLEVLAYLHYQDQKENKNKVYYKHLLTLCSLFAVLVIWILIAFIINPRFIYESMAPYFLFGFSLKIPAGFYICLVGSLVLLLIAGIKFIIRILKARKHESK